MFGDDLRQYVYHITYDRDVFIHCRQVKYWFLQGLLVFDLITFRELQRMMMAKREIKQQNLQMKTKTLA